MTEYKIGDKLRFISTDSMCFSYGKVYEVASVIGTTIYATNDYGRSHGLSGKYLYENFDIVTEPTEEIPVEASPTVIAILANISRRLYEAEQTIKSQAYEINELYKEVSR